MFSSNMPSSYGDNSTLLDDDQPLISPILFSLLLCLTYGKILLGMCTSQTSGLFNFSQEEWQGRQS